MDWIKTMLPLGSIARWSISEEMTIKENLETVLS